MWLNKKDILFYLVGELCYRLWLIYDKKELKKNNLECDIFSEEVKIAIELQVILYKLFKDEDEKTFWYYICGSCDAFPARKDWSCLRSELCLANRGCSLDAAEVENF